MYIGCIMSLIVLAYIIIKWKYGFWMRQPVYHIYDIQYYFKPPQVISKSLPEKNKYVNQINIHTRFTSTLQEHEWCSFAIFLQKYFLRELHNTYNPKLENIVPYFKHPKSMCSFYYDTIEYKNINGTIIVNDRNLVGVMTSRPVFGILGDVSIPIYYVDNLCVSSRHRKSGIAASIIQTHHYNQRRLNPDIHVSLFKRENDMTWIVPLTYFNTYVYDVKGYEIDVRVHAKFKILNIKHDNIHRIMQFISENRSKYNVCIYDGSETILENINTNNVIIYAVVNTDINYIVAVYIFKVPRVTIKHNNVINCIGSIKGNITEEVFYYVFIDILQKINIVNKMLAIECISDNTILVSRMTDPKPIYTTPTAYFLYNYICSPINSDKCLIIL